MESQLLLLIGSVLIAAGVVLAARPNITAWVADNWNRKTAEWLAQRGIRKPLDEFPREIAMMKIVIPIACLIIGAGFWVSAFTL